MQPFPRLPITLVCGGDWKGGEGWRAKPNTMENLGDAAGFEVVLDGEGCGRGRRRGVNVNSY
jgi:hypothetical protein